MQLWQHSKIKIFWNKFSQGSERLTHGKLQNIIEKKLLKKYQVFQDDEKILNQREIVFAKHFECSKFHLRVYVKRLNC